MRSIKPTGEIQIRPSSGMLLEAAPRCANEVGRREASANRFTTYTHKLLATSTSRLRPAIMRCSGKIRPRATLSSVYTTIYIKDYCYKREWVEFLVEKLADEALYSAISPPKKTMVKAMTREDRDRMIPKDCKRLAEVDFPIAEVSRHAAREKSIRHGHPSTLHLWWARRPLASSRAVLLGLLLPDPCDPLCPTGSR